MIPAFALALFLGASDTTAPELETRTQAARHLDAALRTVRDDAEGRTDRERAEALRRAAGEAALVLGSGSRNAARLDALARATEASYGTLRRDLLSVTTDLVFTPVVDAPRPVGFPGATPAGEVALLDHGPSRLARVRMSSGWGGENSAFWKLFRHIDSRQIPMTAPVEMTYDASGRVEESMAFLYASTDVGRTGSAESGVEVVDVPAVRVASFGLRGARSDERIRAARAEIDAWLAQRKDLLVAGPARVMAWNGPMTPTARQFYEVQVPVRAVETVALQGKE